MKCMGLRIDLERMSLIKDTSEETRYSKDGMSEEMEHKDQAMTA
jgi:hypothetical protein